MSTFEYQALTESGRLLKGTVESSSPAEAGELLEQMGLSVSSIEKVRAPAVKTAIGRNEFLLFNRQLASIAQAGIPLPSALRQVASDATSSRMRKLIGQIAEDLESGMNVREAFEKHRKHFPPLYGRIIEAGIKSGRLSEMLMSLNRHGESAAETRRIIFESASYPLVVLTLALAILTFILTILVPSFVGVFAEVGVRSPLPVITRAMFWLSSNIIPIWIVVGAIIVVGVLSMFMLSGFPAGRRVKETILSNIPIFGRLHRYGALSRLADAMALLIGSGDDMPSTLKLAGGVSGSELIIRDCELLASHVERGEKLLDAAPQCRMIPGLFLYSMETGSQRNELAENLYNLAEMYASQVKVNQGRIQAAMLPILMIILGFGMMFIIVGTFGPIIGLMSSLEAM